MAYYIKTGDHLKIVHSINDDLDEKSYRKIDKDWIPTDRIFRDSWEIDLTVNIPKAKEIWKEKLRVERLPLFEANDILLRDAMVEDDADKKAIALAERDRLRDITLLVDECETPAEIKKITL